MKNPVVFNNAFGILFTIQGSFVDLDAQSEVWKHALVQHGGNKPIIPNQGNTYAVLILTFEFRLAVLVPQDFEEIRILKLLVF